MCGVEHFSVVYLVWPKRVVFRSHLREREEQWWLEKPEIAERKGWSMFTLMEDDQIGRIRSDFEECGKNQSGIFLPMQDTNTVCIFEPLRPIFNVYLHI